jgi:hypothetical protein
MTLNRSIPRKIGSYYLAQQNDPHHRYRSWEHCYAFFRRTGPRRLISNRDAAAMHLGLYLASWGMYRGSGFLLQHAYTAHLTVVDSLALSSLSDLWNVDFGSSGQDRELIPIIVRATEIIKEGYRAFGNASDTLATKVLLGTIGCLPACDRYFVAGFKSLGLEYSKVNKPFVECLLDFCSHNLIGLRREQTRIERISTIHSPPMKLIDMYFWQIGFDLEQERRQH